MISRQLRGVLGALFVGGSMLIGTASLADDPAIADLYRASYQAEARSENALALAKAKEIAAKGTSGYFLQARIAWLSYLTGDFVNAERCYREASASAPKAIEPRLGLTLALMAQKKWRDLETACKEVIALDPANAIARARLAHALYSIGNYPDCATAYRKLVEDYPAELDHQTGLGWALLKMGRRAEARQQFTSVISVSPDNLNARQGLAVP